VRTRRPAREPLARAQRQPLVGDAELRLVHRGLLEVVAEDFVELDQRRAVSLEPLGKALVQLRACRLRQRVIRGVSDQEVAEAERVVRGDLRGVRTDQALADERDETGRHHASLG
jgi:hypothetical protein